MMFDLFIFFIGFALIGALFYRICKEGDYDDYD